MSATASLPFAGPFEVDHNPNREAKSIHRQIPSLRNREVFAAVVTGKSHSQAAAEFGLTQPRVTQIVQQVRDWMNQVTRGEEFDYTEVQRLRVAEETLRIQLDGWMRMAMQEWFKSCKESFGRTTFLSQAARLSANLARLAGVDVTGKTARALAEQQDRAERLLRAQRAEKPLWNLEPESPAAPSQPSVAPEATPVAADVCEGQTVPEPATMELVNDENNPYGLVGSEQRADLGGCISLALRQPAPPPAASIPADKPVPKFLDKKVRKRLLALRREQTLAAMRAPVG